MLCRVQIWGMVQRVQRFLGHSYTIQTWLDEDFLYVYFLWINIPNNPLGVSPSPLSVLLGVAAYYLYRDFEWL